MFVFICTVTAVTACTTHRIPFNKIFQDVSEDFVRLIDSWLQRESGGRFGFISVPCSLKSQPYDDRLVKSHPT